MPKARYEGIYQELLRRIEVGDYAYQSLLPPESELTEQFSCSRNTLRRALSMLADNLYVQPIHGKGVRVIWREKTHNAIGVLEGIESFGEYSARNGMTASTEVKVIEHILCGDALANRSGFNVGDALTRVVRVRSLDGRARQIDHGYFLESVAPGTVTVQLAGEEDCAYLDLGPYNCVAVMEGQSFDSNGIMFEYTCTRIHPEIFCYQMTSRR